MAAALICAAVAAAQPAVVRPAADASNLSEFVLRAIEAPYLSDAERAELRVWHGVWTDADLEIPTLRAKAALMAGVFDDAAFDHPDALPEDRAEAMLRRGDHELALESLAGRQSARARMLRAQTLAGLGRFEDADVAVDPVVTGLIRNQTRSADDLVAGVRSLSLRAELRGQPSRDYQAMMQLLARARDELDRGFWPAPLAEAELLYDKDNPGEALEAISSTLALNLASADAWRLRGLLMVGAFNFDASGKISDVLDDIAQRVTGSPTERSPFGAEIQARAWIRQKDPDMAEEAIAASLDRYPRMRSLLAVRCAIEAIRYDFAEVERLLEEFDQLSPGSPLALFEVGAALAEARQYEEAAEYLNRAVERQPRWPQPLIELGLLELQSGRDQEAAKALRVVATLDPFNKRAANSLELIEELLTYETVESEHFIVRFKPGIDRVMAEDMLVPLEEIHEIVSTGIDFEPTRKTVIELMPDHAWFAVRITGMPAIHTIAACTGPVIAMEVPKIGPRHTGEYDWVRVVRHEYVHTVTLERTKNRIPHWFTEAAAVYLEDSPRDYNTCLLLTNALRNGTLFDMRKINIAFVRPEKPTDRSQAYAQGHWMYEFMIERYGAPAPLELMDLYAEGVREDEAMQRVLGVPTREFFEKFTDWAHEQASSWGMLPEPSIASLLLEELQKTPEGRTAISAALSSFAADVGLVTSGVGGVPAMDLELPDPTPLMVNTWLTQHPEHPDLLERRAQFMIERAGGVITEELVKALEEYAAARPVDPAPHRILARHFLDEGQEDARSRAIGALEFLDAREQYQTAFAVALANLYAGKGLIDEARVKAERATRVAPFDPGHRELAAKLALVQKDYEEAERHLTALAALEPAQSIHERRLEALRQRMNRN